MAFNFFKKKQKLDLGPPPIQKITLSSFSNRLAQQLGRTIFTLAQQRNVKVAISIERMDHRVFLYVDDGLSAVNLNWINRKVNVVKHFKKSSLAVKHQLQSENKSLSKHYGLDDEHHVAKGGAIPIFTNEEEMIAIVTVSGLKDIDDHNIVLDAFVELQNDLTFQLK